MTNSSILFNGRLPQRVVPDGWRTALADGAVMKDDRAPIVLSIAMNGATDPIRQYSRTAGGARSDWQEVRDAGFHGSHDLIWCSDDPGWVVYWDAQEDVCVCGTAGDRCLPWDVEIFWLPALGALEPDGIPAQHPSARSQEMHRSYGATMLPLCAADELVLRVLECCASIGGGIESVEKLRSLASYLRYGRLLSPPLAGVRDVLELVDECSFVPEPRNRALWSEAVLSEIDKRTCDVLRAWQQRLDGAKACIRHWAQQPRNLPGRG